MAALLTFAVIFFSVEMHDSSLPCTHLGCLVLFFQKSSNSYSNVGSVVHLPAYCLVWLARMDAPALVRPPPPPCRGGAGSLDDVGSLRVCWLSLSLSHSLSRSVSLSLTATETLKGMVAAKVLGRRRQADGRGDVKSVGGRLLS